MKKIMGILLGVPLLLTGCGDKEQSSIAEDDGKMKFIKTSVLYDTLKDMYNNPDNYLGKTYHMVGTLYPATDDGETFYSVYADGTGGQEGIGLELDWNDFSGFTDHETITVEGKLEKEKGTHDGKEIEYLILRVSKIEKRDS